MATRQFTGGQAQSKLPAYRKDSKMRAYDLIYDSSVGQLRCGLYTLLDKIFEFDQTDILWTIEPGYEHRIDLISTKFYDTAKYDWVIETANNIKDPIRDIIVGKQIIIPNRTKIFAVL